MSDSKPVTINANIGRAPMGGSGRFLSERARPLDTRHTLRRLVALFRPRLKGVVTVFILVSISSVCGLIVPWLIGRVIDGAGGVIPVSPILIIVILCVVYAADGSVSWIQARLMAQISQMVVKDLRNQLFASMVSLPLSVFDSRDHGDLMSRMSNDIDNIALGLAQSGSQMLGSILGVGGALLLMLLLSPILTLAALVTVPLIFILTTIVSRKTRGFFRDQQVALGALNAHLDETVNGFIEVKIFDREGDVISRFDGLNERLCAYGTQAQIWAGFMMPLMNVINNFGFAVLAGVGGYLSIGGFISVGLIASFMGYSRQFGRPLNEIANAWSGLQSAIAGAERVFEIRDEKREPIDRPESIALKNPRGEIVFKEVSFAYRAGEPILKNLSLCVSPGATIAIVGPTGSGKTTLVNLLLRFYEPDRGQILLDGRELCQWRKSSLRRAFGVVLQDTWLFEGSVEENIRYGCPDATSEKIEWAARTANADNFIRRLPNSYKTKIRSGGINLSQGQRQLLAIARAVLADAPFLILDEATSNIDTRTEFHLQEAMINLMKGRTCFIIAHRLSTIRDADQIILIDGGIILEAGSHAELLSGGGKYAAMYHASLSRL